VSAPLGPFFPYFLHDEHLPSFLFHSHSYRVLFTPRVFNYLISYFSTYPFPTSKFCGRLIALFNSLPHTAFRGNSKLPSKIQFKEISLSLKLYTPFESCETPCSVGHPVATADDNATKEPDGLCKTMTGNVHLVGRKHTVNFTT